MAKFNVGDKVKIAPGQKYSGKIGEIIDCEGVSNPRYCVEFPDGYSTNYFGDTSIVAANSTSPVVANALAWKAKTACNGHETGEMPAGYSKEVTIDKSEKPGWWIVWDYDGISKFYEAKSEQEARDWCKRKGLRVFNSAPVARNAVELKVGDIVTYRDFSKNIKLKVKSIIPAMNGWDRNIVAEVYQGSITDDSSRFQKA